MCQYCTYVNSSATGLCEMCNLSSRDSAGASLPRSLQQTKDQPPPEGPRPPPEGSRGHLEGPQLGPGGHLEAKRQKTMREDGLHLVQQIRVGHMTQRRRNEFCTLIVCIVWIYIYLFIYIYIHFKNIYLIICIYFFIFIYTNICIYIYTQTIYLFVFRHIYIFHIYIHKYIYLYTYVCV